MHLKIIVTAIFAGFIIIAPAQQISGVVFATDAHGSHRNDHKEPLPGANVYWSGTQSGTTTDAKGKFSIEFPAIENNLLVVSFVGYKNDSITVKSNQKTIEVVLRSDIELEEVVIATRASGTHVSRLDPLYTENITTAELQKAACCNLSESFETNASVDISYSDAVTGAKQIELLGLKGTYSQILTENIPNLRGLATSYGLGYIPGPWMESIQVSKGSASVINGFESITGQINIEYLKPAETDKLYFNAYGNSHGKFEANAVSGIKINEKWSTGIFVHGELLSHMVDDNDDSFLDMPMNRQINFFNRWIYLSGDHISTQFGFKVLDEDRTGGQKDFMTDMVRDTNNPYGINIKTRRYEGYWKGGYVFDRPGTSVGMQHQFIHHSQGSYFGLNDYDAEENSYYFNLIFQSYIGNTNHSFSTGASFELRNFIENLNDSAFTHFERIPGIFFQYTYTHGEKFTAIAGIRGDHHNDFGFFATPRVHLKYNFTENTILRASAGLGYRTSHLIAENNSILASSRRIIISEEPEQEKAANYGLNLTQYVDILGRELRLSGEVYRTDFINQVILDYDKDPRIVQVYNLSGKSYSNVFQVEASYELIDRLDMTLAFRYNDVKMTTNDILQYKPLLNRYKGLITLSYATNLNKWQFDFTTQFNGRGRVPSTISNPSQYQRKDASPAYTIINAQVTKNFKKWNIYLGGENLTNFKQHDPIIAADDPFSEYFDSSQIWGPISGITIYAGLRIYIK